MPHPYRPLLCRRRRPGAAFLLLEAIIGLTILAGVLGTLMAGFMVGFRAIRENNVTITAMLLAQRLLDEYEIMPPESGREEGDFGDTYPGFTWQRSIWSEEIPYEGERVSKADNDLAELAMVNLRIYHTDGRDREPILAFEVYSALTQFERFSVQSRLRNGLYLQED